MKTWKIITTAFLAIAAIALLTSTAYGYMGGFGGMMGGNGGGMMGGYGYGQYSPQAPTQTVSPTYQAVYPFQYGGGCPGRLGLNTYVGPNYNTEKGPITINTAATVAQNYVTAIGNPDLEVVQVEEYTNNFYVQVSEASTGKGAFELLINKYTGSIYPEMGPNMMWNTKYGMMRGGILSGIFGAPTATSTITQTQAITNAQTYLTSYLPGTTTGDITAFYGYYTIEILNGTTPYGMLSVNGYTGQVWFHNWHGTFIQELAP
jgi:hypothetical protein